MTIPSFEEDYESKEFIEANQKKFKLRGQTFRSRMPTMDEIDQLAGSKEDESVGLKIFENLLLPADYKKFHKACNDKSNPVQPGTYKKILQAISGGGDDPK